METLDITSGVIRSALLEKKGLSATSILKWTDLAVRLHRGPIDRPLTDIDRKNAVELRRIMREAVPLLDRLRTEHASQRMRQKAIRYLKIVAAEVERAQSLSRRRP
jgi:hypothetical protein